MRASAFLFAVVVLGSSACRGSSESGKATEKAPGTAPATTPTTPASDPELEQLKAVTPVNACASLTKEKLAAVFPGISFEVHQKVEPRMSGYVWDSRCVYWAGVGTVQHAKDAPTHTLDLFVATAATKEKAQARLNSRFESASGITGYMAQPDLGQGAHSTATTGVVSLYFVNGQSEVQINVSDLDTPTEEKTRRAVAVAKSL